METTTTNMQEEKTSATVLERMIQMRSDMDKIVAVNFDLIPPSEVAEASNIVASQKQLLEASMLTVQEATVAFEDTMRRLEGYQLRLARKEAVKARRQRWQLQVNLIKEQLHSAAQDTLANLTKAEEESTTSEKNNEESRHEAVAEHTSKEVLSSSSSEEEKEEEEVYTLEDSSYEQTVAEDQEEHTEEKNYLQEDDQEEEKYSLEEDERKNDHVQAEYNEEKEYQQDASKAFKIEEDNYKEDDDDQQENETDESVQEEEEADSREPSDQGDYIEAVTGDQEDYLELEATSDQEQEELEAEEEENGARRKEEFGVDMPIQEGDEENSSSEEGDHRRSREDVDFRGLTRPPSSASESMSPSRKLKEIERPMSPESARAAEIAVAAEDLRAAKIALGPRSEDEKKKTDASFGNLFNVFGLSVTKPDIEWTPENAVAEAFNEAPEEAAGWIHKRNDDHEKKWKRRWFVLKSHDDLGPFLEYSADPGGQVVGRIMLAGCEVRALDSNLGSPTSPSKKNDPTASLYEFEITHRHQVKRELGSVNRQTRKQWVSVLSQLIREHARTHRRKDDELLLRATSSSSVDRSASPRRDLNPSFWASTSHPANGIFPQPGAQANIDLDTEDNETSSAAAARSPHDRANPESKARAKLNLRKAKLRLTLLHARQQSDTLDSDVYF